MTLRIILFTSLSGEIVVSGVQCTVKFNDSDNLYNCGNKCDFDIVTFVRYCTQLIAMKRRLLREKAP